MTIIAYCLLFVEVVCSILLIGIILMQKTKSEGLGMAFGGGSGESLFGTRAGNILTKGTIGLAIVFIVTTILLGLIFSESGKRGLMGGVHQSRIPASSAAPASKGDQQQSPALPIDQKNPNESALPVQNN